MRCRMDLFELPDRHLRVDLRRVQPRMSEHLLDEPDVGPVFEHQYRHGVPEQVASAALSRLAIA